MVSFWRAGRSTGRQATTSFVESNGSKQSEGSPCRCLCQSDGAGQASLERSLLIRPHINAHGSSWLAFRIPFSLLPTNVLLPPDQRPPPSSTHLSLVSPAILSARVAASLKNHAADIAVQQLVELVQSLSLFFLARRNRFLGRVVLHYWTPCILLHRKAARRKVKGAQQRPSSHTPWPRSLRPQHRLLYASCQVKNITARSRVLLAAGSNRVPDRATFVP